jgi:autotransporter beta-domain protein
MNNNLIQAKKDLKAFAKRAKNVKYTESLLFSYLVTGLITFSIGINTSSSVLYERMNKELIMSAEQTRNVIKKKKKENEESIEDLNLELIELMEQGDQVVKSPWSSWQYGVNTFMSSSNGTYKGRGDKAEKYRYNGIYTRGNWAEAGVLSSRRYGVSSLSTLMDSRNYGLASLLHVQEPEVEIQIMANVRPKSVTKEEITINPQIDMPRPVVKPAINLNVTKPISAPKIFLPSLSPVTIDVSKPETPATPTGVTAPNIGMNLQPPTISVDITAPALSMKIEAPNPSATAVSIVSPKVSEVSAISVKKPSSPSVTPPSPSVNTVSFTVPSLANFGNTTAGIKSMSGNKNIDGRYRMSDVTPRGIGNTNGKQNSFGEYMWKDNKKFTISERSSLDLDVSGARAISLDAGLRKEEGGKHGSRDSAGVITYGVQFSVENNGEILLNAPTTAGMDIQADIWDFSQVTAINGLTGRIIGNKTNQAALLITNENTSSSKKNEMVLINKGKIIMNKDDSAGFATDNFRRYKNDKGIWEEGKNIEIIAKNEGSITLGGNKNHGMVVGKTENPFVENSIFENIGDITINGSESGGITLLAELPKGAINSGTITINGNNSFGLYSEAAVTVPTSIIKNTGNINIENGATGSMGIRVGSASATNMSNASGGIITIKSSSGTGNIGIYSGTATTTNAGTINIENGNTGMYLTKTTTPSSNVTDNINSGNINITGSNGYGVMLIKNEAKFKNSGTIAATGTNSIGLYTESDSSVKDTVINEQGATISSSNYHAVVQNGGILTNAGLISTASGGNAALYTNNGGTFTNTNTGEIKSTNGGIAIFTSGSTGIVEGKITVGDSANGNTGIGVYSDGSTTKTTFRGSDAKLILGEGTVGLYSSKASDFGNVFEITDLNASIGDRAVFAYFGKTGNPTNDTVNITNNTLQNLTVSKMGTNSAVFYGANDTTINIADNITANSTKFSKVDDTAQFLVSDKGNVNINSGKILTSGLKTTISGLNKAVVTNNGTLALAGKNGAIGIYSNDSTVTNNYKITTANDSSIAIYGKNGSTLKNGAAGQITTSGISSVGMLSDQSIVENEAGGQITTLGTGSAGVYGTNDSTITNKGTLTTKATGSAGIYANDSDATNASGATITVEKGSSAGMYATSNKTKTIKNEGTIEVGNAANSTEEKSIGIYGKSTGGTLTVDNDNIINIHNQKSIGIYAQKAGGNVVANNKLKITSDTGSEEAIGVMAEDGATANNTTSGVIELKGKASVGMYGKGNSTIENEGNIKLTNTDPASKSVGMLANTGSATNKGTIEMLGGASAGMQGLGGATITNDATTGIINIKGDASAGIYTKNSNSSNAGTINVESNKSAGIFGSVDNTGNYTMSNSGTISLTGTGKKQSAGMYAEIASGATGSMTMTNNKNITVGQEESAAMYLKNQASNQTQGTVINAANAQIDLNANKTVGISVENAVGKNQGVINVSKGSSAGMYGKSDSDISNEKTINVTHEGSAGMYASNSNAKNTSTGKITVNISGASSGSAGMYGELTTAVNKNHSIVNAGEIELTGNTKNVGIYGTTKDGVSNTLTLQNDEKITIGSGSPQSVGIFAVNGDTVTTSNNADKLKAINNKTIEVNSTESIGISAQKSTVENNGTIVMNKDKSAGIYGKLNSEVTNKGSITASDEKSAGIYLEDSNAENAAGANIIVNKNSSAGIYGKFTDKSLTDKTIKNNGTITLNATTGQIKSAGIYGELASNMAHKLTIDNNEKINVNMEESVGILAKNTTGNKDNLVANNNKEIDVNGKKSVGMLSNKSVVNNKKKILVNAEKATGMYGENGSEILNDNNAEIEITAAGKSGTGIYATGSNTTGTNNGKIKINGEKGTGMFVNAQAAITNNSEITGTAKSVIGMYGSDSGTTLKNANGGKIELSGEKSTGIYAQDDSIAENAGEITLKQSAKNSVGMFGSATSGKKINLTNAASTGIINVESEKSTGMFANNASILADSVIKNEGNINLKAKNTVGIYTPNSMIAKVGNITLNDDADSSVAVYLTEKATVSDTTTGNINLGTQNQNRVAYYIKGTGASDTGKINGANIGKVTGYGVGVYLDGGVLDGSSSKLDYTTGGATGNGIIGLLMKGSSADISSYTGGIKVGNTDGNFYAVGLYTDNQGTSTTPKAITTAITTGANGVGLIAENGSNLAYTGTMTIGDGKDAGTGIYVGNNGTSGTPNPSKVTVTGTTINLNGSNGVGAIVTTGSTVNIDGTTTINFEGDGVGVYGQKGAHVTNSAVLNTKGHSVERTRVTEGSSIIAANLTGAAAADSGNIISHVINGETIVNPGITVEAKSGTQNIIGLMADGIKNPSPTHTSWKGDVGYEAINNGKIDLSNATTSTAMYLDSSRGINKDEIVVGNKSTGIYGVYNDTTSIYSDAAAGTKNEGKIMTTAGSKITIGDESSAIYAIDFDKVENNGSITGGDKSVGIYAKNTTGLSTAKNIDVTNTGNITLGKGSAGIYIAPETTNNPNATVVNSGNIIVGDSILNASGVATSTSVGIYATNKTNLTTTGNVTVGNKGFALYGNDSNLTVNGGNYNFANNGSLAYLENGSVLNYNNTGTLTTSSEPMLYIIDSKANMNNNDIVVSANGTGVYMTGNSTFSGWNNMTLNSGSTGIYVENSKATIDGKNITGTANKAKGIVAINSDVTNKANMQFSDDDSIGIFSRNNSGSAKNIVNTGNIDITGERSIAAYLEGTSDQIFENSGTINVDKTTTSVKNDSTVGIYAQNGSKINVKNSGTINVGESSFGIYSLSENGNVETTGSSVINVADKAIGIYKKGGTANVGGIINVANHIATDPNSEPVGIYGSSGVTVTDTTTNFNVGDKSYGVILANPGIGKTNVYSNSASSNITLGKESTFIYTEGASNVTNNATMTSGTNDKIIAIYGKDGANIVNNGMIDLSNGIGNQGILVTGASNAVNRGVIKVGKTDNSDPNNIVYGIGMAAINGASISNDRDIYVSGHLSIGMYGDDRGTTLKNSGNIYLDPSSATATDKIQTMMGVFVNNGAKFVNTGNITTVGSYHGNNNVQGLVGVAVLNGSTLENYGKIDIDADSSYGVLIKGTAANKSIIKNYGEINISGLRSYGVRYDADSQGVSGNLPIGTDAIPANVLPALNGGVGTITSTNGANDYYAPKDPSKTLAGVGIIQLPNGRLAIQRNGVVLNDSQVQTFNYAPQTTNFALSNFGVYVDTLGRTRPINVNGATNIGIDSDLLIGTEFSVLTNAKDVIIGKQILQPFLNQINAGIFNFTPYSASLTWMATPEVDPSTQQITRVLMTKIPYTAFVARKSNEYNFTDGLEQRYDKNALDSREKEVFNKLNTIGNSEEALLVQAYDEMMGHQYANVQQRIFETGNMLNKEFRYLRDEWDTKSKQSNKIKVFGMKGEYKTDTAGIIDYRNDAYGFAYLHEDETVKLGESSGWYAGAIRNKFDFSDIGKSKEEQNMIKAGVFKSMPLGYDNHNNEWNWTVAAEGFIGNAEMNRKFLVVDDIFEAKSDYYSYGVGLKNELRKNIRLSERTSLSPYGNLKLEYGRFNGIKEDSGQVRLEVKGNDYYSIKPEVGVEFKYKQPMAVRTTFTAKLGLAYENELGQVGDVNNQARVRYTTADWFNIRGEKDDRRGNGKVDLNLGIENTRFGVTVNAGYDTKGENVRGGIGFRAIY